MVAVADQTDVVAPRPEVGKPPLAAIFGAAAVVLAGVLVGLALGIRDVRTVFFDDAAITMRYAARISGGDGWTYNDGDRTNGASAPLYTMLLTFLHLIGFQLETAVRLVAVVCYAATFGLAARLGHRIAGPVAGIAAIIFLAGSVQFRLLAMSGMESGLAAALGLAAILLAVNRREWLAGVVVGLAVLNKLDAGFLAIAIAIALTLAHHRLPWRLVVGAVAVFAPWAIFSQLYFGAILPNSAAEKLGNESEGVVLNHAWIFNNIRYDHGVPVLILGIAALVGVVFLLIRRDQERFAGLLALMVWPALHILAFSYLNFGGTYSWYTTVIYPPICVAAACTLGLILRRGWQTPHLMARVVAVGLVLGLGFYAVNHHKQEWRQAKVVLTHGHQMDGYEYFEQTRKQSGIYLSQVASPGDVIATCFGWPAYEAPQMTIKETCPLNTRNPVAEPTWYDGISWMEYDENRIPKPDFHLDQTFESPHPDGGNTRLYKRDGS